MLEAFILHRREVVTRRTVFELRKARDRAHILEGLAISLVNIEEIINLIRQSPTPAEAKLALQARGWNLGDVAAMLETSGVDAARPDGLAIEFGIRDNQYFMTEIQAQAILDLRLHKLTGLEHEKILAEYKELLDIIAALLFILENPARLMEVIEEELMEVRDNFADPRRTEITASETDLCMEDLIVEEDVVVTLSHEGYVKYQPLSDYEAQRRGGKGKAATKMKDEDFIEKLLVASTHDTILCFSTRGRLYWLKTFQLPLASRQARGRPIVNILPLEEGERITAILPVREYEDDKYVFMATANGTVKKTALSAYSRPRSSGLIAINLNDDNELIGVALTDGTNEIMLFSDAGKVVRFKEAEESEVTDEEGNVVLDENGNPEIKFKGVRPMGRTATGVRGIKLNEGGKVVSLIVPNATGHILTTTENGYGKRTPLEDYSSKSRATQGVISIKVSARNGKVVGAVQVDENDEIMLISNRGTLVRTRVSEVSVVGRNTQGVTLIRTADDEKIVALQRIEEIKDLPVYAEVDEEGNPILPIASEAGDELEESEQIDEQVDDIDESETDASE
jgi:DNA gyrase subunit A